MDIYRNLTKVRYVKSLLFGVVVSLILLCTIIVPCAIKEPIQNATAKELTEIQGIGETKAELIVNYLEYNENATVDDLQEIKGIGTILVSRIKKDYR